MAGVLFGAGKGTTLGSFAPRVGTYLASLAPDIGQKPGPVGLPSTPPLIAHAPPSEGSPTLVSSSDATWQRLAGPQELATEPEDCVACERESTPWPAAPVALSPDFDKTFADTSPGDAFKPWASVKAEVEQAQPAVVAIPGAVAGGDPGSPPEWFDIARNVLAVVGLAFLFLQLVRFVT
jgi:hypothetical protein